MDEEAAGLLARDMRHAIGIGSAPIEKLETILEMHGVRIVRPVFARQFQSGSSFNSTVRTLVIVLNVANTKAGNDYRLAYELGAAAVFAMSDFTTIRDEGGVHRFLRRFTAAFLMPEESVRKDVAQLVPASSQSDGTPAEGFLVPGHFHRTVKGEEAMTVYAHSLPGKHTYGTDCFFGGKEKARDFSRARAHCAIGKADDLSKLLFELVVRICRATNSKL